MKTSKKDAFLILRLPQDFKELLMKEAEKAKKSLSKYVRSILEKR